MTANEQQAFSVFNEIAQRGGEQVAPLFQQYSINKPVTGANLYQAVKQYGSVFSGRLYDVLTAPYSNADGSTPTAKNTFTDLLSKATDILSTVNGLVNSPTPNKQTGTGAQSPTDQPEPKKIFGIPVIYAAGLGVILLLVAILLIVRKK